MNDYFTQYIIKELESIERDADRAWKIAWHSEDREEVDTTDTKPSWFKR